MKSTRVLFVFMLAVLGVCLIPAAYAGLGDLLKDAKQAVGLGGELSDSKIFKPIVHKAMSTMGVTRKYQDLNKEMSRMPLGKGLNFDLDEYVTDSALKGLFYMLAEEEKKIRKDPAARVTKLLKDVFGSE